MPVQIHSAMHSSQNDARRARLARWGSGPLRAIREVATAPASHAVAAAGAIHVPATPRTLGKSAPRGIPLKLQVQGLSAVGPAALPERMGSFTACADERVTMRTLDDERRCQHGEGIEPCTAIGIRAVCKIMKMMINQ